MLNSRALRARDQSRGQACIEVTKLAFRLLIEGSVVLTNSTSASYLAKVYSFSSMKTQTTFPGFFS